MNESNSKDDRLTLELLDAIEQRSDVSQRHLARQLGIALGLANSYLKRCAKKGYVKVREVPANRYLYYLTPKGFAEKTKLTAQFLSTSLTFYRQAAESCSELYLECDKREWGRIVLCGASDLAEIAYTKAMTRPVKVLGIYDSRSEHSELGVLPIWADWNLVKDADAYMITDLEDPLRMYGEIVDHVADANCILVPSVLRLEAAIKYR